MGIPVISQSVRAEGPHSTRRLGLQLGFNADPAPSSLSLNLAYNVLPFARFNFGIGGYNDAIVGNMATGLYNFTFRPAMYFFAYVFTWLFSGGDTKLSYDNFLKIPYGSPTKASTTYGAGLRFMLPNAEFTPTLGVHLSKVESQDDFGLGSAGMNLYYSAGVDYQSSKNFLNVGAGMNFCPQTSSTCGFYLLVGAFFD